MNMSNVQWIRNARRAAVAIAALALAAGAARANDIAVTNVGLSLVTGEPGQTDVEFDLSWANSWRATWTPASGPPAVTNWDAAWVFVKYRQGGGWQHATLATNGHTAPAGAVIDTPTDGTGVFIYRSANGWSGAAVYTNVNLRWPFADDGVEAAEAVDIAVHAIEMVYVAEGEFAVGSGGTGSGELYEGGGGTNPFEITNAGPIECGDEVGKLWGASQSGNNSMGGSGTISSNFPNGYTAFYCMKHEITQGQYADFLNTLTDTQDDNRYPDESGDSYTISGSYTNYSATVRDRACNYLSWADLTAFADWAGLRPMTELEFEKACRGPLTPVADEHAWGTVDITAQTGHSGTENGTETATPSGANCCYNNNMGGPVRAGIYATNGATRAAAGASYWGIMELSGNLWERPVTIGNANGRAFTGLHGNGALTTNGDADASNWPGTDASGTEFRGGNWYDGSVRARASDRDLAAYVYAGRYYSFGGRAVRSAPSGVGP